MCVSEGVGDGGKRLGASAGRLRRSSCSSQPARRMCLEMPGSRFKSGQNYLVQAKFHLRISMRRIFQLRVKVEISRSEDFIRINRSGILSRVFLNSSANLKDIKRAGIHILLVFLNLNKSLAIYFERVTRCIANLVTFQPV